MSIIFSSEMLSIRAVALIAGTAAVLLFSGCSGSDGENNPVTISPTVITKNGTISGAESWAEAGKVYRVNADCSIEAQVTWGSGVTVSVDPAARIRIGNHGVLIIQEKVTVKLGNSACFVIGGHSPGTLIAAGTASNPIVFKADSGVSAWGSCSDTRCGGIVFGDSAINSILSYCTISGATTGIYAGAGSPVINNCTVTSCKDDGILFDSTAAPADFATFTNNSLGDCGGYPLTLPASLLGNLSGKIDFTGRAGSKKAIRVIGTIVEDSAAFWRKKDVPYLFTGMTVISSFQMFSNVTIMPGVECRFEAGACIGIGDPRFGSGLLIARGTPNDSIYFVNSMPEIGWGDSTGGIQIGMESPINTVLEYCAIRNATTGIYVNPGVRVTVSHCRVSGCAYNGITFAGGSPLDSLAFRENYFVGNGGYGIGITADQLVNLSGTGSVSGNGRGGIYVTGAEIGQSGTWKKHDVPYIVEGVLDIGTADGVEINISPGVELGFLPGAYIRVGNSAPGTLAATGTAALPVTLTSAVDGANWGAGADGVTGGGIRIEQFSDARTSLISCDIRRATSGVYVNARVTIQDCLFQENRYYGLVRDKNADKTLISRNSYSGNGIDSIFTVQ